MGVGEKSKVFPYAFTFFSMNKIKIILQSSKRKKKYHEYLFLKCREEKFSGPGGINWQRSFCEPCQVGLSRCCCQDHIEKNILLFYATKSQSGVTSPPLFPFNWEAHGQKEIFSYSYWWNLLYWLFSHFGALRDSPPRFQKGCSIFSHAAHCLTRVRLVLGSSSSDLLTDHRGVLHTSA